MFEEIVLALVVGIPALTGVALIVIAVRRWLALRALGTSGRQATARVVDNQMESRSEGRMSFRPIVTFRTDSGQEITTPLADLGGFRSHVVGTEIAVLYDPANPSAAAPVRGTRGRLAATVVFGVIFLAFAVCAYGVGRTALDPADFTGP
ncbi:hypothetical protein ACTI_50410 [Actinoplanes sp. OR16]|uniref:DUF3592 domain-containing protein n=1 Tax=Actinoplanes sp. OR16 TaxID=946334 RepID=UPI000F6D2AAF|nr:DUF3592 domain-containing protein [Actinoplanes sp. OR16]BBH68356.1 hypothetical protein ACTI_50410 [Actinoplanes sp. OR16]